MGGFAQRTFPFIIFLPCIKTRFVALHLNNPFSNRSAALRSGFFYSPVLDGHSPEHSNYSSKLLSFQPAKANLRARIRASKRFPLLTTFINLTKHRNDV